MRAPSGRARSHGGCRRLARATARTGRREASSTPRAPGSGDVDGRRRPHARAAPAASSTAYVAARNRSRGAPRGDHGRRAGIVEDMRRRLAADVRAMAAQAPSQVDVLGEHPLLRRPPDLLERAAAEQQARRWPTAPCEPDRHPSSPRGTADRRVRVRHAAGRGRTATSGHGGKRMDRALGLAAGQGEPGGDSATRMFAPARSRASSARAAARHPRRPPEATRPACARPRGSWPRRSRDLLGSDHGGPRRTVARGRAEPSVEQLSITHTLARPAHAAGASESRHRMSSSRVS